MERLSKSISEAVTSSSFMAEVMKKVDNIAMNFLQWLEFSGRYRIEELSNGYYRMVIDCDWHLDIKEVNDDIKASFSDKGDFWAFKEIVLNAFWKYSLNLYQEEAMKLEI